MPWNTYKLLKAYYLQPVVHLEDANFKVVDISIKTEPIDILNHCKGRYFRHYSHFKSLKRLSIVSPDHKLVA